MLEETKKPRKIRDENSLRLQASFLALIFLSVLWRTVCRICLPEIQCRSLSLHAELTLTLCVSPVLEKTVLILILRKTQGNTHECSVLCNLFKHTCLFQSLYWKSLRTFTEEKGGGAIWQVLSDAFITLSEQTTLMAVFALKFSLFTQISKAKLKQSIA